MDYRGRLAAAALAASGTLPLAVFAILEGDAFRRAAFFIALAACLAILLPIAWMLGRHVDRLRVTAAQDDLTKTWNRKFVTEAFPRLMHQATRNRKKLSVTIVDINDFKMINDSYGHHAGDQVLQRIAGALTECASKGEIVSRWGGDEFVVVCPYGRNAGEPLSEKIRQALEQLSLKIGVHVSASIGTAVFPEDGHTLAELLKSADARMYGDKLRQKTDTAYSEQRMLQA